jgi:uncharacterized tellurite resistance protein B-like protein
LCLPRRQAADTGATVAHGQQQAAQNQVVIQALRHFLQSLSAPAGETGPSALSVELATAVLLVEAMRADADMDAQERAAILDSLKEHFALESADVDELLALAERTSRQANDYFAFTNALNERLGQEQKIEVVEQMWRIAYVDGSADAGEHHVISKVAGLLHVTHGDYIAAKMRAKEAAGRSGH